MADDDAAVAAKMPTSLELADERTILAYERTLMAWVRTATSLISFGFTIYKFFQLRDDPRPDYVLGAREFAMLMIGTGITCLLLATYQHVNYRRELKKRLPDTPWSVGLLAAGLVSILGILAVVLTVLRQ